MPDKHIYRCKHCFELYVCIKILARNYLLHHGSLTLDPTIEYITDLCSFASCNFFEDEGVRSQVYKTFA